MDDGTEEGRPAGSGGMWETTVDIPTFDPLSLEVEWKSLPPTLMYAILDLPYRMERLNREILREYNYEDAPDFPIFFRARRHGFATLGLEVSKLASQLREHAGLPIDTPGPEAWDRDGSMREQIEEVTRKRAEVQARVLARNASMNVASTSD